MITHDPVQFSHKIEMFIYIYILADLREDFYKINS